MNKENSLTPMLNLYPDSMGGTLKDVTQFLASDDLKDSFGSIYILPSIYNTDLDRGFSVIDYNINELFASEEDLEKIKALGLDLKLDFILTMLRFFLRNSRICWRMGKNQSTKTSLSIGMNSGPVVAK